MSTVQPPVLVSKIVTLLFAATLITLVVMIVAISKMMPLEKPQVFFLQTAPQQNLEISISSYSPDSGNMELFRENFVKEYVRIRNEIIPDFDIVRRRWANDMRTWSTDKVYAAFQNTQMYTALMNEDPEFELLCPVEFRNIARRSADTYAVNFSYFCSNNNGQLPEKNYTIVIKLEFVPRVKWEEKLDNPLGVRVTEYKVEAGGNDPLDFIQ